MFVVRDKTNMLCGYKEKPTLDKDKGEWNNLNDSDDGCCLSSCKFDNYVDVPTGFEELKWDDEPREVDLYDIGMSKRYEELKDSYDSLYMKYLSQVSLYKSLYKQAMQNNQIKEEITDKFNEHEVQNY